MLGFHGQTGLLAWASGLGFLAELKARNGLLFHFGMANLGLALLFALLSRGDWPEVAGANAWYKPMKFALSIGLYALTMGWLLHELPAGRGTEAVGWLTVAALGFEIAYIGLQAWRGQASHFNVSTPMYAGLYQLMALAATSVSVATLYVALRFFQEDFPALPMHYVWAIRLGLLLFVVFSLEGFVMGARLSHTIGGPDGGPGLPFLGWSRRFGDPRVAHFVGMHALQALPLLSWYLLKSVRGTLAASALYGLLAVYVLAQALQGRPFLR
jgi:hypothetical protein